MKILFDENMPFAREFFESIGGNKNTLEAFNGRKLTAEQLVDADVLLVRSITKVNEVLLEKAKQLKFVGTATIGVDHIDQALLKARSIAFYSAPGCNAVSVAEYVISALVVLAERYLLTLKDKTVGIVGAGNTGSRLSEKLTALGITHKLCDPILAQSGDTRNFVSLDEALACDIISLHVPLTREGEHPTYHLLDETRLAVLSGEQILINACRGEVIDNHALLKLKQSGIQTKLVLDVWENEPNVLEPLVPFADIASAHIAGYSLEGKARGSEMLYRALCKTLAIEPELSLKQFLPTPAFDSVKINQDFDEILLKHVVKMVYDVRRDDAIFRQQLPRYGFDHIRKTYPARREFSSLACSSENTELDALFQLGFERLCN
ncbi:MAG: 4-phosphoerythronate dehydrogenase [Thalassotalea sp.]|nr:4-phosphoerythronate dehydrogenase [Thalassotalea sp.]